ncbi:MAG: tyrosine/phenylalanine carboxypeptidase domain-containing protein [Balneolaceae bacterium]
MKKSQALGVPFDEFIEDVTQKLNGSKQVRMELPDGGLLHFDRPLPFLVVYRQPVDDDNRSVSLLVRSQTSFLITPANGKPEDLKALVHAIAKTISNRSGAFLIIEIWAQQPTSKSGENTSSDHCQSVHLQTKAESEADFLIRAPHEISYSSVSSLKNNLEEIRIGYQNATAEISLEDRHPPKLIQLLEADELKELGALLIGVEIRPFYINSKTDAPYPLLLRKLARELSKALHRTFFEFVRVQTSLEVSHFQMLGRRLMTGSAREIDSKLAQIDDSFRFLQLVTPINIQEAWLDFKSNHFEKKPQFHYRLMSEDPETLKRELYNLSIERVEDPTLEFMFREKRSELDKMLTLLTERGKPEFMPGSMQYYGPLEESVTTLASNLLSAIPPNSDSCEISRISPEDFAVLAREEIDYYRTRYEPIDAEVHVQDDIAGMLVSNGNLHIGTDARIASVRAEALIQHEVGTHILTYYNGRAQQLKLLYCGLPRYEELQEGLAVLSEYLVGGLSSSRLRLLAARVVTVQAIMRGADFVETFHMLHEDHGFDARHSFTIAMRVYRGGGLTKDAIYLKGLMRVLKWLEEGNELEPLLIGKIREDYLPLIDELLYRGILRPAPFRPHYLDYPEARSKLEQLKLGSSVLDLLLEQMIATTY